MYGAITHGAILAEEFRQKQFSSPQPRHKTREALSIERLTESGAERRKDGWYQDGVFLGTDSATAIESLCA